MKKIMLMLLLTVGVTAFVKAQDAPEKKTPEERAAQMTKMMQKHLSLTDDQTKQINAILLDRAAKADEPKIKGVKGGRATRMQAKADEEAKINAVLTPDQQKTYAAMQEKIKEKALDKRKQKETPPPPPPAPPAGQ